MNKRYYFMLLIILVDMVFGSGFWWASSRIQAQEPSSLAGLALQPEDLSNNAPWLSAGMTGLDNISQPLNSPNPMHNHALDAATLLAYNDAYETEVVELDDDGSTDAVIANYLYQYADRRHAQVAAQCAVGMLMQADGLRMLTDAATGETVRISPADDTANYFWVEANDQILSLLRVEGLSTRTTKHLFTEMVAQVSSDEAR